MSTPSEIKLKTDQLLQKVAKDCSLTLGVHLKTVPGVELQQVSIADLTYVLAELDPPVVYLPPFLPVQGEETEGSSLTCQYRLNGENEGSARHDSYYCQLLPSRCALQQKFTRSKNSFYLQ